MWGISWVPWGVCSTVGGYHPLKFEYRRGISWCMWGDIMSTVGVFSTMGYSNNKRLSPYGTQHPPRYSWYPPRPSWNPPRYWTSSTVLNTPTVLKISPHLSWYPHSTEHPHGTQDIPHGAHDIPHGTEHPPRYWTPPRYCTHIIQGGYEENM